MSNAAGSSASAVGSQNVQERRLMGLSAFDRHQSLMKNAIKYYRAQLPPEQQTVKTDFDVLKEQHRFVRTAEDDINDSWDVRMARRYYSKLFKEYAVADLSRYRESKVGLRWRTEREVVIGKGQFVCGAKGCDERRALASYEVNFAYKEAGERKQALVKVRLCPKHAMQLNHKQNQQLIKKRKQELHKEQIEHSKRQKHSQKASGSNSKLDHSSNSDGSPESHGEWETGGQGAHGKTSKVDKLFEGLFD
ncbi:TPA: hypothetical protein ACH3X1_003997 [Trebouxia sp. C0004]